MIHPAKGRCWFTSKENFQNLIDDNRIWFGKKGDGVPRLKKFQSEVQAGFVPLTIWKHNEVGHNQEARQELNRLFDGSSFFDTPKPKRLIKRMLEVSTSQNNSEIVLDFFAGSCTTAHAAMELNKEDGGRRKFVMVQLPEETEENSQAFQSGYKTIADIGKDRIRRVSKKIKGEMETNPDIFHDKNIDLGFKSFTLEPSNFKIWRTDTIDNEEDLKRQMEAFVDPVRKGADADNMAWEILLKSGYELTTPLERTEIAGIPVYKIANGEQILMLESLSQKSIDEIIKQKPGRVVCLDRLFNGNDQLKTNTALQMKDAGVEFRTV